MRTGVLWFLVAGWVQDEPPPRVDFKKEIEPLLRDSCLKCHGPEGKAKGQLRLDQKAFALRGGTSGPALVPGRPEASPLYKLLLDPDPEVRMPQKAPPLAKASSERIRRWIAEGASWPAEAENGGPALQWSLRPLQRPPVPPAGSWARTPVDAFILSELARRGFSPAPPADRRTLLRRVTYDLVGLPPTPEEMDAFQADGAPDAYEKVVDRLLGSPRYGERWARHWLDVIHFADTHGHDQDRPRPHAWPYRDYVIVSLNQDKPYAQFVQEQLAGDILYPDDPQGTVATGFISAGPWDESSQMHIMADTVDKKIAQNLDRDDMVMTAVSTFLSTTIHCARCHNHKFDPITQKEYYALQACFAGVDRANRPYDDDPPTHRRRQELLGKKADLAARRSSTMEALSGPEVDREIALWEKRDAADTGAAWTVLDPEDWSSDHGATLRKLDDGSLLSTGECPETDTYTIRARTGLSGITAVRLEVLTVEELPRKGPGRQENGNFHLSEFRVLSEEGKPFPLKHPTADFNQEGWSIAQAIDGKVETAWGIFPEIGKPHVAVFELGVPAGPGRLTFVLEQKHGGRHLIARPRLSVTTSPLPVGVHSCPGPIAAIARKPVAERSPSERTDLALHVVTERLDRELASLPPPRMVYGAARDFPPIAKFTPARVPRPIHVLKRGDVTQPGLEAQPGALAMVPGLDPVFRLPDPQDEGERRAALARWITDPRNVLTWRSIVNRVWHYHFGRGLVDTPNDFGKMGGTPSHPDLLDWLANYLQDQGGSLKKLHRLLVTSAVYLQGSRHEPGYARTDSGNVSLYRMNRIRLDAEEIRDGLLLVAGKLDLRMGGPSVRQFRFEDPNPDLTPKVDYARFDLDHPDNFRRSVYRYLFRTLPDPFMDSLDCADASQLTPCRNQSLTPLQAMSLLNNRFVLRLSEHLAARIGDRPDSVREAYRLLFQREPTAEEIRRVGEYRARFGLANACRMLLNSNEFMFLD